MSRSCAALTSGKLPQDVVTRPTNLCMLTNTSKAVREFNESPPRTPEEFFGFSFSQGKFPIADECLSCGLFLSHIGHRR